MCIVGLSDYFIYKTSFPFFDRLSYASGILIPIFLLAWIYQYSCNHPKTRNTVFLCIIGFILFLLPLTSDLVIFDIHKDPALGLSDEKGVLFPLYVFLYFLTYIIVLFRLFKLWRREDSSVEEQKQLKIIFTGFSIYGASGILFGLVLPLFGYEKFTDFDILFSVIFVFFMAYAIVKHQWMSIKIISIQILSISIIAVVLMDFIFTSSTTSQRLYKVEALVLLITLTIFLIRSVFQETLREKEALAKANLDLQKLDQAKTEFINITAHQLRTPLTAIKNALALFQNGEAENYEPAVRKRFYDGAWIKCRKLDDIVKNILVANDINNHRLHPDDEVNGTINLQETFDKILLDYEVEIMRRDLKVTLLPIHPTDAFITGQAYFIESALDNIINNAIKYTPSKVQTYEVRGKRNDNQDGIIEISVKQDQERKDRVLIQIVDNGIGIPKEAQEKVFEKFARAENAHAMYTDGTGLGLWIAKTIVEAHQGEVAIESEVDKGTTVQVWLLRG
jgi:signal transduction histidine kinase